MGKSALKRARVAGKRLLIPDRYYVYLWLYALIITAAELAVTYVNPMYGAICHLVLFFALLVHATVTFSKAQKTVYLALLLAPLVRLMSLTIPLVKVPPVYWYLVISIPLFAAAVSIIRLMKLKMPDIGLTAKDLPLQAAVALLGIPFGFIEYLILRPVPMVGELNPQQIWLPALSLLLGTGFLEELVFRGVMLRAISNNFGTKLAAIYVSLVFAAMHIYYRSFADLIFVFAVALIFSVITVFSRSIIGVSLAHGLTNMCLYIVFPLLK